MVKLLGAIALALSLTACDQIAKSNATEIPHNNRSQANDIETRVIYGEDNRVDVYDIGDNYWLEKSKSTVALINNSSLALSADGSSYEISSQKIGSAYDLCVDEPFYDQPTAAFCSGSLIGPNIVITAGHCIQNQASCERTSFVFNFAYQQPGAHPDNVSVDDVYKCSQVIYTEVVGSRGSDYAIMKLDRDVVGRTPLTVRPSGKVNVDEPIVVIGHPSGLPTKFADGASVRENTHKDYFVANLDTYGGNSGSAVFNEVTGDIEGILVRGESDYVFSNGCRKSNVCTEEGCRGEDVTRVTKIWNHISRSDLEPQSISQ